MQAAKELWHRLKSVPQPKSGTGLQPVQGSESHQPSFSAASAWKGALAIFVLSGVAASLIFGSRPAPIAKDPAARKARFIELYQKLPLSFEANQGQADGTVKFLSRGPGYTLLLTTTDAVLQIANSDSSLRNEKSPISGTPHSAFRTPHLKVPSPTLLRMKLVGANPTAKVSGLEELPGKSNYFLGNDPSQWLTNVPNFAKVRYEAVYPGIDLVFYGNQGQLEFDFQVTAGANPNVIELGILGADEVRIDSRGDLILHSDGELAHLRRPLMYQVISGSRERIQGEYVIPSKNRIAFRLGSYDLSRPLVIDPILSYATYVGGERTDQAWSIAVDSSGNAYIAGQTNSGNFPTTGGAFQRNCSHCSPDNNDAFVVKMNAAGSALLYSTYLGGNLPVVSYDIGFGIAVDSSGNAYVTGITSSSNFPTTPSAVQRTPSGGGDHVFVTKLSPTGSELIYSTYLGRAIQNTAIAVDTAGNAYVAGSTGSVFVTKLNRSGSALVYSRVIGPGVPSEIPGGGIAVDSAGNAYVTGETSSTNFPVTGGAFQTACNSCPFFSDAFVTKLDASGSIVYSTYLGGSGKDRGLAIAVISGGNAHVSGSTTSPNFPTLSALQPTKEGSVDEENAFVAKLNTSGSGMVFSTYLGGNRGGSAAYGIAVDALGNAYLTGTRIEDVGKVVFVTKLNQAGSALVYSVRIDRGFGFGITVDSAGNTYVTGVSSNLPTTTGAFQASYGGGGWDGFVVKILGPPSINPGGMVNAASFAGQLPAAGGIATLFGTNLAASAQQADRVPLPTTLGGTRVELNGIAAPLFFVSPTQINFQIPWQLAGQTQASVVVTLDGVTSSPQTVNLSGFSPGLFALTQTGTGQGAVLIAGTAIIAAPSGSFAGARPVRRGESISIFCTGLGAASNPPASGAPASLQSLSPTTTNPSVTIGGIQATVSFSGLAPGFVGLYQVNAEVPPNSPNGNAVQVVLTIGGLVSNTVTIAVE